MDHRSTKELADWLAQLKAEPSASLPAGSTEVDSLGHLPEAIEDEIDRAGLTRFEGNRQQRRAQKAQARKGGRQQSRN